MSIAVITDTLASMIRMATPLMLMALGGLLCQRAGVFNIALEGFSLVGAFAAIAVVQFTGGSVWAGLLGAMVIGAVYSSLYALFVTKFKADNIIASIAMNMLGAGLTSYLLRTIFNVQGAYSPDEIHKLSMIKIPIIKDIPILSCLSGQSIVTYFAIIMVVVIYVVLFKTKIGLSICAVGESEVAAKTAGIKPNLIKWQVVLMSGALCGLAGAYLSTISVSQFSEDMIQGRGFNAFTAFVFGNAHPVFASLVTLLFGFADAIGIRIELLGMNISPSIIKMFPFVFAIIALMISSYTSKLKKLGVIGNKKKKEKTA
ncbi:MAG: ABC transporter permease [Hespellia sp.]|nr:ABC transporter permease [Hespellia sp.]